MNRRLTDKHVAHIVSLERNGKTTAEAILADAKAPESPIHDLYDWDVTKAAEAHWLNRTREIVRLVRYVVHTETTTVTLPRYVRDPEAEPRVQGYATVERLRTDPRLARRALISEFERVANALKRARAVAVGLELDDQISDVLARVVGMQAIVRADVETSASTETGQAASPA